MAKLDLENIEGLNYSYDLENNAFNVDIEIAGMSFSRKFDLVTNGEINPDCLKIVKLVEHLKEKEEIKEQFLENQKQNEEPELTFEQRVEQITPEDQAILNEYFMGDPFSVANQMTEIMEKYGMTEAELKTAQLYHRNKTVEQVVNNYNEQFNEFDENYSAYDDNTVVNNDRPEKEEEPVEKENEEVEIDDMTQLKENQTSIVNNNPSHIVTNRMDELDYALKDLLQQVLSDDELDKELEKLSRKYDISERSVRTLYNREKKVERTKEKIAKRRLIKKNLQRKFSLSKENKFTKAKGLNKIKPSKKTETLWGKIIDKVNNRIKEEIMLAEDLLDSTLLAPIHFVKRTAHRLSEKWGLTDKIEVSEPVMEEEPDKKEITETPTMVQPVNPEEFTEEELNDLEGFMQQATEDELGVTLSPEEQLNNLLEQRDILINLQNQATQEEIDIEPKGKTM